MCWRHRSSHWETVWHSALRRKKKRRRIDKMRNRHPELLIPASSLEVLKTAVMFGAEMIALFFSSYVMKFPTNAYKTNPATFYILTIISKIIYFAVTQFIAFIINKLKFKSNNSTRFIPLFIFPFISIAISVLFLRMSFVNNYDNRYNISFIILNIINLYLV